jgi:WD40 repeat protein
MAGDYLLCVVGKDHPRQVLSKGWRGTGRLCWSKNGGEIWISGVQAGGDPGLYAVDLSGRQRLISQLAGRILLQDVARDGRVLISVGNSRVGILFVSPDSSSVRDLAWMDVSMPYDLSDDGKLLLFAELSYSQGRNSAIYVRKTDGSPAVRVGWGAHPALSPDGKWVACIRHEEARSEVALLPTGPGESRTAGAEGMRYETVEWYPDGKHVLITGAADGKPVRSWVASLEGGGLRPLTPEGVRATRISPDGLSYLVAGADKLLLGAVSGGAPMPLCDLEPGESVIRWSGDGRYLFLRQTLRRDMRISRMAVATGRRETWREVKVPEVGAVFFGRAAMSADGTALACSFQHDIADLWVVTGLK